ncbi:MAG: hypothetical protein E6R05_00620 [Candidatus Moraniibacteriota bacterium]|nr:MAG: hypothetical protein E6R05_00620 [Candidatus Moranbacteria bacterium]
MNTPSQKNNFLWSDVLEKPVDLQISLFRQASSQLNANDVKYGFRAFASDLFARDLISVAEYVTIFGGHVIKCVTPDQSGIFRDMATGTDASTLTEVYSRAKYGRVKDIKYLADVLISYLCEELEKPHSEWFNLFQSAKLSGDNVVMMTTGWRNVPSMANILYEIVVEEGNVKLAHIALPTIINIKLPRIAPPCEDYASLSLEEREYFNLTQDHVIPAENFYRWSGVHVIFGDDVLVTGSTADKVLFESIQSGAKSFRAIYPIAIDPRVALIDASVEDRLNSVVIGQKLNNIVADLVSEENYQPVLRTLRLLFGESNRGELERFLPKIPALVWLKLYKSALNNDFLGQASCAPSLITLRIYLNKLGLL